MWSTALKVLQEGDTLYHTTTSHWGWALSYARSLLEPHPQAVMYAELLKDENGYGIAFIRIAEQTPEAPG